MGQKIDQLVITLLLSVACCMLLLSFTEHLFLSIALTIGFNVLLRSFFKKHATHKRMNRRQAQKHLLRWASESEESSRAEIATILGEIDHDAIFLRHPTFSISSSDIFHAWKLHRGEKKLRIIATCYADGRARTFAKTLSDPMIELMDASRLIPLIRKSNLEIPHEPFGKDFLKKIRQLLIALPERRSWQKNLLYGCLFMFLYVCTGNAAYLFLSLAALFLAGVRIKAQRHI